METHIRVVHSETPRNTADAESSASTSDKENKLEAAQQQPLSHQQPSHHHFQQMAANGPTAALINLSSMSEGHPIPTSTSVYESYMRSAATTSTTSAHNTASVISTLSGHHQQVMESDLRFTGSPFYSRVSPTMSMPPTMCHRDLGLNLLAAANDELAIGNYHQQRLDTSQHLLHASKFQIPAAAHYHRHAVPPSPSSESSRSSPSPKLEIVEPEPPVYLLRDYPRQPHASVMANGLSQPPSVIIQVPYPDGLTPSSSTSTSPVPSSPDPVDVTAYAKDELCLPPRKRTKMILKSMEEDRANTNFRYSSVIQYAKASQIFQLH